MKSIKLYSLMMVGIVLLLFCFEMNPVSAAEIRDRKYVNYTMDGYSIHVNACVERGSGYGYRMIDQYGTDYGQSYYYYDGRYSGTLPRTGTVDLGTDTRPQPPCSTEAHAGTTFQRQYNYRAIFAGWVEAPVSDPTNGGTQPNTSNGSANGRTYWELRRPDLNKASGIYAESGYSITGSHYATRNPSNWFNLGGITAQSASPISRYSENSLKGSSLNYSFSYEYTNYYRNVYNCTDSRGGSCYAWVYAGQVADWGRGNTYSISGSIPIDHSQKELVKRASMDEVLSQRWIVGRVDSRTPSLQRTPFYEQLRRTGDNDRKNIYNLKTQSYLPVTPGKWIYEIELPSNQHTSTAFNPFQRGGSSGYYYPIDIDESLKDSYKK